jgi:RNA polymerase sigma factor (sigma-70 family)
VIARGLNRSHPGQPTRSDLFWSIWQNHSAFLAQRSVRLSGGNRADAEDALSNAMLRAVQSFSTQDVQNPRAWLLRILHNIAMDTHRQNGRHLPVDEISGEPPTPAASFDQKTEPTPEETLAQTQFNRALQAALRQLPGDYLTPLMLHLDDVPDDEIARRLNISQALVRKRRQLAKERLRQLLNRE